MNARGDMLTRALEELKRKGIAVNVGDLISFDTLGEKLLMRIVRAHPAQEPICPQAPQRSFNSRGNVC